MIRPTLLAPDLRLGLVACKAPRSRPRRPVVAPLYGRRVPIGESLAGLLVLDPFVEAPGAFDDRGESERHDTFDHGTALAALRWPYDVPHQRFADEPSRWLTEDGTPPAAN